VILDWVPGISRPTQQGLAHFDGTAFTNTPIRAKGFQPDWNTADLQFRPPRGRQLPLLGNALFWVDRYHIDGLRVDAVASMLYLDYSREGEWMPNPDGGRENREAIAFLARQRSVLLRSFPGAMTIAEESTAWPACRSRSTRAASASASSGTWAGCTTRSLHVGGSDLSALPVNKMTFRPSVCLQRKLRLPLSHDEVVHGKGSLSSARCRATVAALRQFARAFTVSCTRHPGKKLLFMGGEFAQDREWNHDRSLDWQPARTPKC
jgi:1,4-alpha-glucan branching enzyme